MIRIISDSTCDLSASEQAELGVIVAPLTINFGEESFQDGLEMSPDQFYDRLKQSDILPKTAQVNPEYFANLFQEAVDAGDTVIGIFLSPLLSGTYQSANIAKDIVDEGEIHIVDSTNVTFGLGLMVRMAVRLRDQGLSAKEVVAELEKLTKRLRLYAVVDTLKYLKLGGRISAATAVVGGMLNINPILNVRDGVVESAGKARGHKAAYQWIEKRIATEPIDTCLPVCFGHACDGKAMEQMEAYFVQRIEGMDVCYGVIGATVGTHIGPGAAGIAYFVKED